MKPDGLQDNYYFGGGASESSVTLLVIAILICGCVLLLGLKRKYMILPFLCCAFLVPFSQVVVILGLHLQVYRLLILVAWIRIIWSAFISKSDPFPERLNTLDKVFLSWALCNAIMYSLLWHVLGAVTNRLGFLYSTLGVYFLLRYTIRDRDDVVRVIKLFALVAVPVAALMVAEHMTGKNPISFLTGIPQFSEIRNDKIRAQGPFAHSIIAGTFGAMLFPVFIGLWWQGKGNRFIALLGLLSSPVIALMSSSSTPIMTLGVGILGLCLWPIRNSMRLVRWGLVLAIIGLQLCMQVPFWFVLARLGPVLGGTGWHRAELIDQFVRHFSEWWMIGTQNNANWGMDMWDSINVYVNAGTEGGLLTFILYIALIVYAFKRVGAARRQAEGNRREERLIWAIGVTLCCNAVAFFGIAYFDQSIIAWYAVLVMISAVAPAAVTVTEPEITFAPVRTPISPAAKRERPWQKPKTAQFS